MEKVKVHQAAGRYELINTEMAKQIAKGMFGYLFYPSHTLTSPCPTRLTTQG